MQYKCPRFSYPICPQKSWAKAKGQKVELHQHQPRCCDNSPLWTCRTIDYRHDLSSQLVPHVPTKIDNSQNKHLPTFWDNWDANTPFLQLGKTTGRGSTVLHCVCNMHPISNLTWCASLCCCSFRVLKEQPWILNSPKNISDVDSCLL